MCGLHLVTPKAKQGCSGKCMGSGACAGKPPTTWVAAACDGMVSLFEKHVEGQFIPIQHAEGAVFSSTEQWQNMLADADKRQVLGQIILVGTKSDIAWLHASLPASISQHVAAEIEYPLVSGWFKQPPSLANALKQVFTA